MTQDDLTAKQSDYAVFLPAISGFYATFIGKQRNEPYVDPARLPQGLSDMEQLNWLNSTKALFPYRWSLYSGGHANLDLAKQDWSEDMVRNREPGTIMLGDSGGFQIAKGVWEGDWRANSGCAKAKATHYNNEYFMKHRKGVANGGTKFLNVLQGGNHTHAEEWYQMMKDYCDPQKYPDTHFNGWAMGGQNMCDVHLVLKRIVALRYDNLLQEGVHDWMHFLGTSKLEWAVLLTVIQRAVRKYVNPNFTISFDCASPFLATANGQVYFENVFENNSKWSYRMAPTADDKKYATDTRAWGTSIVADGVVPRWEDSPISKLLKMKDICIYKPGDLNKNGKEGKTSWDSFSYALLMGHNVWMHLTAVQEANRRFDAGEHPAMMRRSTGDYAYFEDIVEDIFTAPTREQAESIVEKYSTYWMEIVGTRGFKGKKTVNATTQFNALFEYEDSESEPDEVDLDSDKLDNLSTEI